MADENNNQSIGDTIRGIVEDAVKSAVHGVGDGIRSIFASTNPNPDIIDEPKGPPKNLSDVDVGNHSYEHHNPKDPSVPSYVKTKFRPIAMTSIASVCGMLPMAFGTGLGSELRSSCGIGVVGGLIYSAVMTLYLIPALYFAFVKDKTAKTA